MTLLPNSSQVWLLVEHRTLGQVIYSFIFIIGLVVNTTALWVFVLTTKRRSSVNIYMLNVALVDLTFILMLPFRMVYLQWDFWPFADFFCRVCATLNIFYPCIALWLFALISADRYTAIVQPKHSKERRNVTKTVLACLGAWLMTLAGTASLLFSGDDPDVIANFTTCFKMVDFVYLHHNDPPKPSAVSPGERVSSSCSTHAASFAESSQPWLMPNFTWLKESCKGEGTDGGGPALSCISSRNPRRTSRASINLPAHRTTLLKQLKREGQQRAAQLSGTPCRTIRPHRDDESYMFSFYVCGGDNRCFGNQMQKR
nr:N-arachidonyl glycine receptor [Syngnathus scovelli]